MGTDYLQLFDKRIARLIIDADEADLVTLVDLRTRRKHAPVWKDYYDSKEERLVAFDRDTPNAIRLRTQLDHGTALREIKEELLRELCTIQDLLYLDYWGCSSEVFPTGPPEAETWEEFIFPIRKAEAEPNGSAGCYLLTGENVDAILLNLQRHRNELSIMTQVEIDRLESWQRFCAKDPGFCILYQIDF